MISIGIKVDHNLTKEENIALGETIVDILNREVDTFRPEIRPEFWRHSTIEELA